MSFCACGEAGAGGSASYGAGSGASDDASDGAGSGACVHIFWCNAKCCVSENY